jgi:hypothetical protein
MIMSQRQPSARHAPLKRAEFEETMTLNPRPRKVPRKPASNPVPTRQKQRVVKPKPRKPKVKEPTSIEEFC